MPVITDPYNYLSNDWSGSDEDDTLIYKSGRDIITGMGGYDTLVIPLPKSDVVLGAYQNNNITLTFFDSVFYTTLEVIAVNIERLQFTDDIVTLVERAATQTPVATVAPVTTPTTNQISIPWGSGGYWTKNKRVGASNKWWQWKRSRKVRRYHLDNDVQTYSSEDIGTTPLALSGGNWTNTQRMATWGGTMLYSGNNVIAFFEDWSVAQFDAASKI